MYGVIKRCTPLLVLVLGSVMLKKGPPSPTTAVAVACISTGCVIAGRWHHYAAPLIHYDLSSVKLRCDLVATIFSSEIYAGPQMKRCCFHDHMLLVNGYMYQH